ncbi:MAG: ParB N-terminal domain-containing protein [Candidatus Dormibacteria bacterium]|jgi:ParB/RepB/Spo0J family partition protein
MPRVKSNAGAVADAFFAPLRQAAARARDPDDATEVPSEAPPEEAPEEAPDEGRAVGSEQVRRRYTSTREIDLALLDVDEVQIRRKMKNVPSLAQSMKRGQWHPVIVTRTPDGRRLHLETGARRVAAARANGWTTIYAAITDEMSRLERLLLQAEENTQRDQLSGEEKKPAYLQIREELGTGTKGAAELLGITARTFRRVVQEVDEAGAKTVSRLSTGQFNKAVARMREGAARLPAAKRREMLENLKGLVHDLEEAENEEAEAAIKAPEFAPPESAQLQGAE